MEANTDSLALDEEAEVTGVFVQWLYTQSISRRRDSEHSSQLARLSY